MLVTVASGRGLTSATRVPKGPDGTSRSNPTHRAHSDGNRIVRHLLRTERTEAPGRDGRRPPLADGRQYRNRIHESPNTSHGGRPLKKVRRDDNGCPVSPGQGTLEYLSTRSREDVIQRRRRSLSCTNRITASHDLHRTVRSLPKQGDPQPTGTGTVGRWDGTPRGPNEHFRAP